MYLCRHEARSLRESESLCPRATSAPCPMGAPQRASHHPSQPMSGTQRLGPPDLRALNPSHCLHLFCLFRLLHPFCLNLFPVYHPPRRGALFPRRGSVIVFELHSGTDPECMLCTIAIHILIPFMSLVLRKTCICHHDCDTILLPDFSPNVLQRYENYSLVPKNAMRFSGSMFLSSSVILS